MVIGMRGHDIGKQPLLDFIENLKRINVAHIQLAPEKAISDIDFSVGNFNPGLASYMGDLLRKEGITVSVLGCYINPNNPVCEIREREIKRFKEHIKYAKFIGAHMVGTETGTYTIDYKADTEFTRTEGAYRLFLKTMRELSLFASSYGVMLGVEGVSTHTLYCPEIIKRFLEDISSPNIHVIFDPINMINIDNHKEQRNLVDKVFNLYGESVAAIHLKDFTVENNKMKVVPIGKGIFDFEYFFHIIKQKKPYINMLIEGTTKENFGSEYDCLEKIYNRA